MKHRKSTKRSLASEDRSRSRGDPLHGSPDQEAQKLLPPRADKWIGIKSLLARPSSGASLAAFRIAVGLVMALEAISLLRPSASTGGKVMLETYYTGPDIKFNLPYAWFEWLPLLPPPWMYALVGLLGLVGVTMALGLFYRVSAAVVFLTWGYLYAVESTRTYWMSYYYLELLVTFLLIWMPAARRYSLDAWLSKGQKSLSTVPSWTVLLLRGQLVITYFYAGVAKLNADWLLDAVPVRDFLARPAVLKRFESHLSAAHLDTVRDILHGNHLAYFLSYSGAVFDLSVGFLLMIRRTRIFAFVLLLLFHATNHFVLFDDLVWFPLLGIATATIFLDPDWPERLWRWLRWPRIIKPDWPWFGAGVILFPVIGAALGWKPKTRSPLPEASELPQLGQCLSVSVVAWLLVQSLLPLRHYLIPGDGRFTWEGLSFSWRLKTEIYRSNPCEIFLKDATIISRDQTGTVRINWNEWKGDKVIYRRVQPGQTHWSLLPEIVVLFEPEIGERVIYNPFAGSDETRTEGESRARLNRIWQELYGRQPQTVRRTVLLTEIIEGYATALRAKGGPTLENRSEILAMLLKLHGREGNGQMIPFLRRMHPFGMQEDRSVSAPFLVIEDAALFHQAPTGLMEVKRDDWKSGDYTRGQTGPQYAYFGGEPLVIHTAEIGVETRSLLPQASIFDSADHPEESASISWDYLKDLTLSKGMHISTQPFLLKRYAERVASLWEKQSGHRPAVCASTGVSLNRRPPQLLVDPNADLASVPVAWFGHNFWIKDLELARIPREKIVPSLRW